MDEFSKMHLTNGCKQVIFCFGYLRPLRCSRQEFWSRFVADSFENHKTFNGGHHGIDRRRKSEIIAKFATKEGDTGSAEVQNCTSYGSYQQLQQQSLQA